MNELETLTLDRPAAQILLAICRTSRGLRRIDLGSLSGLSPARTHQALDRLLATGLIEHDRAYWPRYRRSSPEAGRAGETLARPQLSAAEIDAVDRLLAQVAARRS